MKSKYDAAVLAINRRIFRDQAILAAFTGLIAEDSSTDVVAWAIKYGNDLTDAAYPVETT